jgi:hypothetical protein
MRFSQHTSKQRYFFSFFASNTKFYFADVVTHLEDVYNAGQTHLEIDNIVGIAKISEFTFSLTPLLAALRHNTYFTSFACHEKSRKEVVALVAGISCRRAETYIYYLIHIFVTFKKNYFF